MSGTTLGRTTTLKTSLIFELRWNILPPELLSVHIKTVKLSITSKSGTYLSLSTQVALG